MARVEVAAMLDKEEESRRLSLRPDGRVWCEGFGRTPPLLALRHARWVVARVG